MRAMCGSLLLDYSISLSFSVSLSLVNERALFLIDGLASLASLAAYTLVSFADLWLLGEECGQLTQVRQILRSTGSQH